MPGSYELVQRPVPTALAEVARGMWFVRGPAPTPYERILPSTEVPLVVPLTVDPYRVHEGDGWRTLGGAFVAGLRQDASISSSGATVGNVGVVLRPDALLAVGLDPRAAAGGVREVSGFGVIEELGADVAADAALEALSRVLLERFDAGWWPDPVVRAAIDRFGEYPQPRVGEIARSAGVSPSALVARFRRTTGVTPKSYADLARLQGLLDRLTQAALDDTGAAGDGGTARAKILWSDLAATAGYYDQSHLTRAFHRFVGLTPTAYIERVRGRGADAVRFVPEEEAPGE